MHAMAEQRDLLNSESSSNSEKAKQSVRFERRWLDRHAGRLMTDPQPALVELVANAWDAYATEVDIRIPRTPGDDFEIRDNGCGMTSAQFEEHWGTVDYDRLARRGAFVNPPPELTDARPRRVFGRNGRGRHAAFYFGERYEVVTWRDGAASEFSVRRGVLNPFDIDPISNRDGSTGHGTIIRVRNAKQIAAQDQRIREWIGTRFLFEPNFEVKVDGVRVDFSTLPEDALREMKFEVGEQPITIRALDTKRPDPHTRQHGIAWWVNGKRVGECSWRGEDYAKILDGRSSDAKRYTFIVIADLLVDAVEPDWSGFAPDAELWKEVYSAVQEQIASMLDDLTAVRRETKKTSVKERSRSTTNKLSPLSRSRWTEFIDKVIENCPSLGEEEIVHLGGILANLELAQSQYGLLERFHAWKPGEFDDLHDILDDWTAGTAKIALDEVATRIKLIRELSQKAQDRTVHEVHGLQPLFARGLWMFGPEFESIEFTSNKTMTTVIADLFGGQTKGSKNRPDFVALPDSTVGFYSRPSFDSRHDEVGTEAVVIVELKRPGIALGEAEKSQVWKYIKELGGKGIIQPTTRVYGFVLGSEIGQGEGAPRQEGDLVAITPILYDTILSRAERRMFNLEDKLGGAPFLTERGQQALL